METLKNIGMETLSNNQVIITMDTKKIFFSYDTPVIAVDYSKQEIILLKGFDYSVTTNKYTNKAFYSFKVSEIKKALANGTQYYDGFTFYTIIDER